VLGSFAEQYQLSKEHATRLGCAFGGGVARTGQMCGAVGGALMVIGLAHGGTAAGDRGSREKTYAVTREFCGRFQERHGSIVCRELLGLDISTPEGLEVAVQKGLFRTRCPVFVRDAAEFARMVL
jgi:C_GCAxxG_C_C family probable redox protein